MAFVSPKRGLSCEASLPLPANLIFNVKPKQLDNPVKRRDARGDVIEILARISHCLLFPIEQDEIVWEILAGRPLTMHDSVPLHGPLSEFRFDFLDEVFAQRPWYSSVEHGTQEANSRLETVHCIPGVLGHLYC